MKKILILLAVLAVAGLGGLWFSLNSIVRKAVLAFGPRALGAPVRLKSVSLSPLSGKGALKGLVIGNPKGFKTENAFELKEVRVGVDLRSLLSDTIVVDEVFIRGPKVTYELGLKGSNIGALLKNVEAFAGGPSAAPKKGAAPGGAAKKIRIRSFAFLEGQVRLSAKVFEGKAAEVPLPDIRMEDIGGTRGATPAAAAAQVFKTLSAAIVKAAAAGNKELSKAVDAAGKAAKQAASGLRGLFGGRKK